MIEQWREFLYPLGFLSSIAFTLRFLLQWISSEKAKKSVVTPSFWKISLAGNLLLLFHSFIQMQFHVCIVQACNAVISWRNLNLMGAPNKQWSLLRVIVALGLSIGVSSLVFLGQAWLFADMDWFRVPVAPWGQSQHTQISWIWHFIGCLGIFLFNSRFWVQWWEAEGQRRSYLSKTFWWLSLLGAILSLIYFIRLGDAVNFIGPLFGLVPYVRNLVLLYRVPTSPATDAAS